MLDNITKNKIEKIINELEDILYSEKKDSKICDEIFRLKTNFNSIEKIDFLNKCESECKKWMPVIESSIGTKVDKKHYNYMAHLLELQFKLNKGYLPESILITDHSTDLQNYAMPLVRRLVPTLCNLDIVDIYKIFNNDKISTDDIYVETFKLPINYNINEKNNDQLLYTLSMSIINNKILETGKCFAGPILFSTNNEIQKTVYMRFILK